MTENIDNSEPNVIENEEKSVEVKTTEADNQVSYILPILVMQNKYLLKKTAKLVFFFF